MSRRQTDKQQKNILFAAGENLRRVLEIHVVNPTHAARYHYVFFIQRAAIIAAGAEEI